MKIVYCIPGLWNTAGMERVLTQKVNWLSQHTDWEIFIVTTELVPKGKRICFFPLDQRVQVKELNIDFNADYHSALITKTWKHICKQSSYRSQFIQWIKENKIDVCISLCGKEIEWLGKAHVPCKCIAEVHFAMDYRAQWIRQTHQGVLWQWIGQILTQRFVHYMRHIDQLVVLTKADQEAWLRAGIEHVQMIANPCCIQPLIEGTHAQPVVLAVGRLEPQKGFDWLIEAWSKIASKYPNWMLNICGEGSQRGELEKKIEDLGLRNSVMMNGLSKDIEREYQQSSLFVLSSRYEGLPLALIEAMSCGLCCIAMDCKQGPRELIEDGKTGWLVPLGDVDILAQKISVAIENDEERQTIGKYAQVYAHNHFGLDPIMNKWVKTISKA